MARHLQFSFMVLVFLLPACGGEVALEQQRGVYTSQGAAKADGTDSCQGACGGQSLSGCWCDAECKFHGDCCSDIDTVCNGTSQTCADLSCGMGYHCEMKGINGGAIPVCIKDSGPHPCAAMMCAPGYHCEAQNNTGVCVEDEPQTCADLSCGMGYHCEMKGINGGAIPVCIKD